MHESIEDGIGNGAIAEVGVPLIDGQLAGDESGTAVVAVIEDFEQVAYGFICQWGDAEVVDRDQVCFGELAIERGALLHGAVAR